MAGSAAAEDGMSNRIETLAEGVTLYLGDCRDIHPGKAWDEMWAKPFNYPAAE